MYRSRRVFVTPGRSRSVADHGVRSRFSITAVARSKRPARHGQRFGVVGGVHVVRRFRGGRRRGRAVGRAQPAADDQRGAGGRPAGAAAVQPPGQRQEQRVLGVQRVLAENDQRVRGHVQKVSDQRRRRRRRRWGEVGAVGQINQNEFFFFLNSTWSIKGLEIRSTPFPSPYVYAYLH